MLLSRARVLASAWLINQFPVDTLWCRLIDLVSVVNEIVSLPLFGAVQTLTYFEDKLLIIICSGIRQFVVWRFQCKFACEFNPNCVLSVCETQVSMSCNITKSSNHLSFLKIKSNANTHIFKII